MVSSPKDVSPNSPLAVVSNYTALISGQSWWGENVSNEPVFITYSFEETPQEYLYEQGMNSAFVGSMQAFTGRERDNARAALEMWGSASGIVFLEADAGAGDIQFGKYDFTYGDDVSDSAGYAYYPEVKLAATGAYDSPIGGDIFINTTNAVVGEDATIYYLLHEIGHAIGLKHPFEGDPTLSPGVDNTTSTVMSYTGPAVDVLGPLDLAAVRFLYGPQSADGAGVSSWSWNEATDTLTQTGLAGDDRLRGTPSGDMMDGAGGNDLLFGGAGNDTLSDFAGSNILLSGTGEDTISAGGGNDTIDAGAGSDQVYAGDGRDTVVLGDGSDYADGEAGHDFINGSGGDDTLAGFDGNDTLLGGTGIDQLYGEAGSDTLIGDPEPPPIAFGSGVISLPADPGNRSIASALDISGNFSTQPDLDVSAAASTPHTKIVATGNGYAHYFSIALSQGNLVHVDIDRTESSFDSYLDVLDGRGNVLLSNDDAGNDAGSPDRTDSALDFEAPADGVYFIRVSTFEAPDSLAVGTRYQLNLSIENQSSTYNRLDGGAGDDILIGNGEYTEYFVDSPGDRVIAGAGADTVRSTINWSLGEQADNLTLLGTSNLNGAGNALDNMIDGNDGRNLLRGYAGNDVLDGNGGIDTLDGGAGDDIFYVFNGATVLIEGANGGHDVVEAYASLTLGANVEDVFLRGGYNAVGNELGNRIVANRDDNLIRGGGGNDVLSGSDGADTLDGGAGADMMDGGLGDDTYYVSDPGDIVGDAPGEGTDTIYASVNFALGAASEFLVLQGSLDLRGYGNQFANRLFGNAGDNTLLGLAGLDLLAGQEGDDKLDGGTGADTMSGGLGDDVYYADNVGDRINESAGQGIDSVYSTKNHALTVNLENLFLQGSGDLAGNGNELANRLYGTDGANLLQGFAGNDLLAGFAGNDKLDGGTGADTMSGGLGDDVYYADNAGDRTNESSGQGIDTVYSALSHTLAANIDNLILQGASDLNALGNELDNRIYANAGANLVSAGAGDDLVFGFAGADTLAGGAGRDVLDLGLDQSRDVVRFLSVGETASAGRDRIVNLDLAGEDRLDFTAVPVSIAAAVNAGALNEASFDADLAAAIGAVQMASGQAVLFDPTSGSANLAGQVYLIVDANRIAGYQAGQDYVVQLSYFAGTLTTDDFI